MTDQPMTDPLEAAQPDTTPTVPTVATEAVVAKRRGAGRGKRALAVVAGVAMVPALYAAASAVTGGGERPSVSAASGTEVEVEHGVTTVKPDDDDSTTPTTPTLPDTTTPTTPTLPEDTTPPPTTPTVPEDTTPPPATEAPAATPQTFTSTGGSITVTFEDGALTLNSVDQADGFTAEVHDQRSDRVEVRFFDAQGKEWRIRVEVEGGGLTQEITFHG